jgi:hypothetical protein
VRGWPPVDAAANGLVCVKNGLSSCSRCLDGRMCMCFLSTERSEMQQVLAGLVHTFFRQRALKPWLEIVGSVHATESFAASQGRSTRARHFFCQSILFACPASVLRCLLFLCGSDGSNSIVATLLEPRPLLHGPRLATSIARDIPHSAAPSLGHVSV